METVEGVDQLTPVILPRYLTFCQRSAALARLEADLLMPIRNREHSVSIADVIGLSGHEDDVVWRLLISDGWLNGVECDAPSLAANFFTSAAFP